MEIVRRDGSEVRSGHHEQRVERQVIGTGQGRMVVGEEGRDVGSRDGGRWRERRELLQQGRYPGMVVEEVQLVGGFVGV